MLDAAQFKKAFEEARENNIELTSGATDTDDKKEAEDEDEEKEKDEKDEEEDGKEGKDE